MGGGVQPPTAPLLASCAEDGTVVLWDLRADAKRLHAFGPGPFGGAVSAVAFTPDGRYLPTANANGTVYSASPPPPSATTAGSTGAAKGRGRTPPRVSSRLASLYDDLQYMIICNFICSKKYV